MFSQKRMALIAVLVLVFGISAFCPAQDKTSFTVVPLGVYGGLSEDNLSSYLIAEAGSPDFVSLDAGSVMPGIRKALEKGSLKEIKIPGNATLIPEAFVLQNQVKAYLISHAHLDHVSGLVINSPDDTNKVIMGLDSTIKSIQDDIFNEKTWPNMGDAGPGFQIKKYHYVTLPPEKDAPIPGTSLTVKSFPLSHVKGFTSTAFLIQGKENCFLYFGDTGPDEVEKASNLKTVWKAVAPLIKEKKLKGMSIEVSFPSDRADNLLFGHLTPAWLLKELKVLAKEIDPEGKSKPLAGFPIIVSHIKPSFQKGQDPKAQIEKELKAGNDLDARFIIPEQGGRLEF